MAEGSPVIGMLERSALPGQTDTVAEFLGTRTGWRPLGWRAQFVLQNADDPAGFLLFTVWRDEASRQAYIRSPAFQPLVAQARALYDPRGTTARTLVLLRYRGLRVREATATLVSVREWVARPETAERAAALVATGPLPPGLQSEYALCDVSRPDHFVFATLWESLEARGRFLRSDAFRRLGEREPNVLFDPAQSRTRVFCLLRREVADDP